MGVSLLTNIRYMYFKIILGDFSAKVGDRKESTTDWLRSTI